MRFWILPLGFLLGWISVSAQPSFFDSHSFSKADTLRGMLRPERTCYDVTHYGLDLKIDPDRKHIEGVVDIEFEVVTSFTRLQIDLFENMKINKIEYKGKELNYTREYDAVFVDFPKVKKGKSGSFQVHYEGNPTVARNAPWDGGFVWSKDKNGDPWIGVACEGDGASLWWPNKDHLSDEPNNGATIKLQVPKGLMAVANGQLKKTTPMGDWIEYEWEVSYPINNYNISVNIANYVHFSDTYEAADGEQLALNYYVLSYNEEKARKQFEQVKPMLSCYEHYFDKYPFWNDGFALVETPYLGMEHQSGIAYGNKYKSGYLGSRSLPGMEWDYIIIHEAGHEYFGNSISAKDVAEIWIHESFTTYMEALYVECMYDYDTAVKYLMSQRRYIQNREPIIGPLNVNWEDWGGNDAYYKGSWMLHTLRHAIGDDEVWFNLLKGFYQKYTRSVISSSAFYDYVQTETGKDYASFFEQYLTYANIPTLQYALKEVDGGLEVTYRWEADVKGFNMPIKLGTAEKYITLNPIEQWKQAIIPNLTKKEFKVATELFLVKTEQLYF